LNVRLVNTIRSIQYFMSKLKTPERNLSFQPCIISYILEERKDEKKKKKFPS
jgi:hypothetical protein